MGGTGEMIPPILIKKPLQQRKINIPSAKALVVFHQLLPDFPAPAIEWVKDVPWVGPIPVPLSSIDMTHRANWTATHEPEKVKKHQELINEGISKPIILALLPGHNKYTCIDAHHRLLAYEAMNKQPIAFVCKVPAMYVEAALTAHSHQYSGGSKLEGSAEEVG